MNSQNTKTNQEEDHNEPSEKKTTFTKSMMTKFINIKVSRELLMLIQSWLLFLVHCFMPL